MTNIPKTESKWEKAKADVIAKYPRAWAFRRARCLTHRKERLWRIMGQMPWDIHSGSGWFATEESAWIGAAKEIKKLEAKRAK